MTSSSQNLSIALFGSNGRMGQAIQEAGTSQGLVVQDAKESATIAACNVIIDFTHPDVLKANLQAAMRHAKPIMVGTTGLEDAHRQALRDASGHIPVFYAPNTSLGNTVMLQLVRQAASALGMDYDIEIHEVHHRHKKDAPSGTSLALAKAAAEERGLNYPDCLQTGSRDGVREPGTIGVAVSRGGGVFGEHTLRFIGAQESLDITHRGFSRALFAEGALRAAKWLIDQRPGFYGMADIT